MIGSVSLSGNFMPKEKVKYLVCNTSANSDSDEACLVVRMTQDMVDECRRLVELSEELIGENDSITEIAWRLPEELNDAVCFGTPLSARVERPIGCCPGSVSIFPIWRSRPFDQQNSDLNENGKELVVRHCDGYSFAWRGWVGEEGAVTSWPYIAIDDLEEGWEAKKTGRQILQD